MVIFRTMTMIIIRINIPDKSLVINNYKIELKNFSFYSVEIIYVNLSKMIPKKC